MEVSQQEEQSTGTLKSRWDGRRAHASVAGVSLVLVATHRYLASWPRRTAADCRRSRSSGVTKGEGVSSRIFWWRRCNDSYGSREVWSVNA